MESPPSDMDRPFEPLGRVRAFTWHGNLKNYSFSDSSTKPDLAVAVKTEPHVTDGQKDDVLNLKKPSTRRNAWGCMSYADLITKAIESVPEKRLTLSQIYAWMIQNVPYFKDKGESNSSVGWKNSVRHNLSLHRKFVRIQNEGTGKSSWWIINNNEVKTCKSPRRRAASMDNKSYEKKRHQTIVVQQNVQEQTPVTDYMQSNVSTAPEVQRLDSFATAFSPMDLRSNERRSVALNAGLLSRIEPTPESTFDDQMIIQPSPLYWNQCHDVNPPYVHSTKGLTETVGESLAELFTPEVNTNYETIFSSNRQLTMLQDVNNDKYISDSSYPSFQDLGGTLPLPPPYAGHSATSEGIFPPVSAKDLQSSASNNQLDLFSSLQCMTRSEVSVNEDLQGDVFPEQKFYQERNEESFANESQAGNSLLRQMLMQTQQKSNSLSGYVDHALEPAMSVDSLLHTHAHPCTSETILPGRSLLSSAKQGLGCKLDYRELQYMTHIDTGGGDQILKEEGYKGEWNFDIISSNADQQKDS